VKTENVCVEKETIKFRQAGYLQSWLVKIPTRTEKLLVVAILFHFVQSFRTLLVQHIILGKKWNLNYKKINLVIKKWRISKTPKRNTHADTAEV
jgi:hypothetical protein